MGLFLFAAYQSTGLGVPTALPVSTPLTLFFFFFFRGKTAGFEP